MHQPRQDFDTSETCIAAHLQEAGAGAVQGAVRPLLHAPPVHEIRLHRVGAGEEGVAAHLHHVVHQQLAQTLLQCHVKPAASAALS